MTSGICPMFNCKELLNKSNLNNWKCGYITSISNNGNTKIDNLRVICTNCNNNMKDNNWLDYEENKIKKYMNDNYFDNDTEIKCKKKNCNNKITINNFRYYKTPKTSTIKPCCNTCYISTK